MTDVTNQTLHNNLKPPLRDATRKLGIYPLQIGQLLEHTIKSTTTNGDKTELAI